MGSQRRQANALTVALDNRSSRRQVVRSGPVRRRYDQAVSDQRGHVDAVKIDFQLQRVGRRTPVDDDFVDHVEVFDTHRLRLREVVAPVHFSLIFSEYLTFQSQPVVQMEVAVLVAKHLLKDVGMLFKLEVTHVAEGSMGKADQRREMAPSELFARPKNGSVSPESDDVIDFLSDLLASVHEHIWQKDPFANVFPLTHLALLHFSDFIDHPLVDKDLNTGEFLLHVFVQPHETEDDIIVERFAVDHDFSWDDTLEVAALQFLIDTRNLCLP